MQIHRLDHVNVLTQDVDRLTSWYRDILGLRRGPRPPFSVAGAWLYLGDAPILHLVAHADAARRNACRIEHFALFATGLAEFLKRLDDFGVGHEIAKVPGSDIVQVNIHDCDGNHIHVDFNAREEDDWS